MEILIADQQIFLFSDQLTPHYAEVKAWEKKMVAFDTMSKVGNFLSHPKDDDFELVYHEHRYQPFWHIKANSRYEYDRLADYKFETHGPEVNSITFLTEKFEAVKGWVKVDVTEHCMQEEKSEIYVDGISGRTQPELANYLTFSPIPVSGELKDMVDKDSIMVPPQMRASAIIRDMLAKLIKGIQADRIKEESINVPSVDLYYRPVYAFQYRWKSKGKEAIVEVDSLTGNVKSGNRIFREYLGKVIDQNFLFDVGADIAGLLLPGGSIAVKVVKKCIDISKSKKTANIME
jgi:hypothetical protein